MVLLIKKKITMDDERVEQLEGNLHLVLEEIERKVREAVDLLVHEGMVQLV